MRSRRRGIIRIAAAVVPLAAAMTGCHAPGAGLRERTIAEAAAPILRLDPDAVWTDAYNRLVELGPECLDYLMRRPAMTRPAAPDDLETLVHTSLVRLLADPRSGPPRLTANCLETTLDLLHFDLKVDGEGLGEVCVTEPGDLRSWTGLFPAGFDHALAARVNVEADRRALHVWWASHRNDAVVTAQRLRPRASRLWHLLARRYADYWHYAVEPRAVLCASPPAAGALLEQATCDYNLTRAACAWLGSQGDSAVQKQLIEMVGSRLPVVAHNARFALRYAPDPRIRAVLERFDAERSPEQAPEESQMPEASVAGVSMK